MIRSRKHNRGFTLIELLVCITIFVIMTALLVIKYGNFNQNILVTNLAYDTALALRTAQTYGLSVKGVKDDSGAAVNCAASGASQQFQCSYGVEFDTSNGGQFFLFAHYPNLGNDGQYNNPAGTGPDEKITTYNMKSGALINGVCVGTNSCDTTGSTGKLDVFFKRPDPNAIICFNGSCNNSSYPYAKITIRTTDGNTRSVSIRSNGQISVDI